MEFFIAWYSGDPYERWVFGHRLFGHTYLVWRLDHDRRQCRRGAIALVQESPAEPEAAVRHRPCSSTSACGSSASSSSSARCTRISCRRTGAITCRRGWTSALYIGTLGAFFMMYLLFVRFLPMIADFRSQRRDAAGRPASSARRRERRQVMSEKTYGLMAEFDSPARDSARGGKSPRRRLPPLGRVHAVPDSRHGQGDGLQKFARRLGRAGVRRRRVLWRRCRPDLVLQRV